MISDEAYDAAYEAFLNAATDDDAVALRDGLNAAYPFIHQAVRDEVDKVLRDKENTYADAGANVTRFATVADYIREVYDGRA